jgi:transposase
MIVPELIRIELENLREENALLRESNARLLEINTRLTAENELLRQKVDMLCRKVFGTSSEKIDLNQMLLFDAQEAKKPEGDGPAPEVEPSPAIIKAKRAKRISREATLPANLPVEETILIPDEVREHPEQYRQVSEEITTKLDYQPAQFKKLVTRRPKYVKRLVSLDDAEADSFFIAPLPVSLKERSLLTPRLAAEIATNRFCDHQPYYRQEQHFLMRHGVHLPRNTMSQWMADLSDDYLSGIYRSMHEEMLLEKYLQADETPIEYLDPGGGKTSQGYLWTLSRPDHKSEDGRGDILYQWHASRAATCLESLLQTPSQTFCGILQCDGYQAYETYRKQREDVELIGCWAHVRRKFFEAKDHKPKLTAWFLRQIQNLYQIEAQLRQHRAGLAERERVRICQSLPIYRRLGKALWKIKAARHILPKSNLGKAIDYALGQWPKLERCFLDGRLEIDNNLIENGIRPTKLGAKNWLFMGSETAGQTNAIWYTLIESCRRRKVDPWKYLVWIFEELPKVKVTAGTFASYTPKAYAKSLSKPRLKKTA